MFFFQASKLKKMSRDDPLKLGEQGHLKRFDTLDGLFPFPNLTAKYSDFSPHVTNSLMTFEIMINRLSPNMTLDEINFTSKIWRSEYVLGISQYFASRKKN